MAGGSLHLDASLSGTPDPLCDTAQTWPAGSVGSAPVARFNPRGCSVVAGRQASQDGGGDAAPSNRVPLPQANSDAELEAWEDEGGAIDQPLAGDRLSELLGRKAVQPFGPAMNRK